LQAQGRYAEAELLFRQALAICRKVLGEEHPLTAQGYNNLAFNLNQQGKYVEAEPLYRKALAIRVKALGAEHPFTAASYTNLGSSLLLQGRYAEAEPLCRAAVASQEVARLRATATGLDRAAYQETSPRLLWSIALLHTGQPVQAWQALEGYFGRGLLDDFSARRVRPWTPDEQHDLDGLNARLGQLDRQIARLVSAKGGLEAHREPFETLAGERQAAQNRLARLAASLGQREVYDLKTIQSRLPADTALVAWVDWKGRPTAARPGGEHWAFLLKGVKGQVRIELRGHEVLRAPTGRFE
jgi:tetratricopeptide (TPR) repeat protein